MKNILFLSLITFTLISCNKKNETILLNNITSKNTFWSLKIIDKDKTNYLGQNYVFQNNKTYLLYQSFAENSLGVEYLDLHSNEKREWDYKNQRFYLSISDPNFVYKVVNYNKDTLWLKNNHNDFILIKHYK
ncbi:hypothetical protein [Chryseobacterium sp. KMC2]|uniref:hypothetical protein n=1 Tax=Chryseobacterium sp. KMC2 TaxID=2800705 RepID=UPI001924CE10|nr:hypothetical protein [Chryseobacterium sp. KMC2]MBL3547242.1 hypothetical protein [Chryseobacterium sp. KMC2]